MIEIDIKLIKDIEEYCSINNIENPSKYVTKLLKKSFMEEKYGKKPDIFNKQENLYIKPTSTIEKNIKEEKVNFIEEVYELNGKNVSKELNPKVLEDLNIKEEIKQETEEIEKPKKNKKRKLS